MPSFLVTGASRGLGYEFVRQFSLEPGNIVIGIARNKAATDALLARDGVKSVTILQADITDRASLLAARAQVEKLTGGSLDYLINNAASTGEDAAFKTLVDFEDNPEVLEKEILSIFNTNVMGVINTTNVFLPLIRKGSVKKVVTISTGLADNDLTNEYEVDVQVPYSISKAAVNVAVAKYNARLKREGILFLSISPGVVNTGTSGAPPPDSDLPAKFFRYAPHWKGPISAEESVTAMMKVVDNSSVANGDGGAFISHLGTKQWL